MRVDDGFTLDERIKRIHKVLTRTMTCSAGLTSSPMSCCLPRTARNVTSSTLKDAAGVFEVWREDEMMQRFKYHKKQKITT